MHCYNLSIPRRGQSKQMSFFQNADIEINSTIQKILSTDLNVSYFIQSKSEMVTQFIMNTVWCEIFAGFNFCERSEERHAGKECRSRRSSYH